jgi:hypothetical protein
VYGGARRIIEAQRRVANGSLSGYEAELMEKKEACGRSARWRLRKGTWRTSSVER